MFVYMKNLIGLLILDIKLDWPEVLKLGFGM